MLKEQSDDGLGHDPQSARCRNGEQRGETNAISH